MGGREGKKEGGVGEKGRERRRKNNGTRVI